MRTLDAQRAGRTAENGARRARRLRIAMRRTSLGIVLVALGAKGIVAVFLGDDEDALRRDLERRFPCATLIDSDVSDLRLVDRVVQLVESPAHHAREVDVPLELLGTEFQRAVWRALRDVPPGCTVSYGELAARIGHPAAVRAVGQACGANPVAVLVPCHRAVRSDGGLSGYRWGIERKRELLARERARSAERAAR